ncbi:arylsulfatase D-like [Puma concolor]|uniref:Arylsulfatase D-like n=1 Tax=Puma concolor TaxID=9696 RepID=A0A6P6IQM0_PUMCO|nr:arylsulfatase D-like [Puma concolor]
MGPRARRGRAAPAARDSWWVLLSLSLLLRTSGFQAANASKPNILLIMADDLGIGDLGCYGNNTLRGQYHPSHNCDTQAKPRHGDESTGMEAHDGYRALQWNGGSGGLPENETTFARILQQQGYATGLIGKWHQGVNCESRDDHCHHPLNHGFDYFYGMPFTLVNDCDPGRPPEVDASTRARLWFYTQVAAFGVLTVALGKIWGLISVPWKAVLGAASLVFLFFASWYASFGFVRRWNCILMRNHDVTEQPMVLERTARLMLQEAVSYIESLEKVRTDPCFRGEILQAIEENGLKNTTFAYFTSDHGGHLEARDERGQLGGWNGIFRGWLHQSAFPATVHERSFLCTPSPTCVG